MIDLVGVPVSVKFAEAVEVTASDFVEVIESVRDELGLFETVFDAVPDGDSERDKL